LFPLLRAPTTLAAMRHELFAHAVCPRWGEQGWITQMLRPASEADPSGHRIGVDLLNF
jgi:hypothetical protein